MHRLHIVVTVVALFGAVRPGSVRAQDGGGWPASPWCYEDVSRDTCRWFVVTELNGFYALSGVTREFTWFWDDGTSYTNRWQISRLAGGGAFGIMRNRGRWALGGSVSALWSGDQNPSTALLLRVRRWLGPETGMDLALGPRLSHSASWIGEAWYEMGDVVALGLRLDAGGGRRRLAVGLRFGSYGGLIGAILALGAAPSTLGK